MAFAMTLLAGQGLAGQESRSILMLLPTEGRTLAAGYEQAGTLGADDYALPGGQHVQAWELKGRAGEGLVLELLSEEFDAYLYLMGPGLAEAVTDDDGAQGCSARLDVVLPADGPYLVVASSISGEGGTFTLKAANEAGPRQDGDDCSFAGGGDGWGWQVEDVPTDGRMLVDGDVVEAELMQGGFTLPDGSPALAWGLLGTAGMTLTIDMESEAFDAILYANGPGLESMAVDDDGAGGCNARLTLTFPEDGEYRVVASSILSSASGPFALRVAADPAPPSDLECSLY